MILRSLIRWQRVFLLVSLAVLGPAHAVPLTFEFSGAVRDVLFGTATSDPASRAEYARIGQSFSATMTFETDGMLRAADSGGGAATERIFYSGDPVGPELFSSSVSIGGTAFQIGGGAGSHSGAIRFRDTVQDPFCAVIPIFCLGLQDEISAGHASYDRPFLDQPTLPIGITHSIAVFFSARDLEFFSLRPDTGPLDLLTMPLPNLSLVLSEVTYDCQNPPNACIQADVVATQLAVTGFTRSLAPVTSVPEPGTFLLFVTALGGLLLWSRRRGADGLQPA